jgi:MFS family permease
LLLLPLYVTNLGGNESNFGLISAAGAVTAAVAIGLLIRFPNSLQPQYVMASTSALYGVTAIVVSFVHSYGLDLIGLGIVLGTAWAVAYTTSPMIISELVDDSKRGTQIGYVTGMIQIGFGLGPIIGHFILQEGMSFGTVFRIAGVVSIVAALAVVGLGKLAPELATIKERVGSGTDSLRRDLVKIFRSPAAVPLIMVLLCACVFTTMNSFQTTFAHREVLNYDVFYATYTIAVIFARFVLVRVLPDPTGARMVRVATVGIVVSTLVFLLVGHNSLIYGIGAAMLGITYGLALPAVQANAVNRSTAELRPRMLPLAGLLFETAILAFPLVAGWIIDVASYEAIFVVLVVFSAAVAALSFVPVRATEADPATATDTAESVAPAANSIPDGNR